MMVYNNAQFNPTDVYSQPTILLSVPSRDACACQCYDNPSCITGTYYGVNQTCILFEASLGQGQLQVVTTDKLTSVFTFPNRTTITYFYNLPPIVEWLFDGNFDDVYGNYDGNSVPDNGTSWMSPGYAGYGSAVCFLSSNYSLVDHYLNLTSTSFTISAWIWIQFNITSSNTYFGLFGHCDSAGVDKCLHAVINKDTIRLDFYSDDLTGNTVMNSNQWHHVAYVYDRSVSKQIVYLNGILDGNRTSDGNYSGNASQITLGTVPSFIKTPFLNGFIDKLTFVSRVKNASELLDEATLVAYYSFDGSYSDSGANNINNNSGISTTFTSFGRFSQGLMINSTSSSYFQTTGFYYLGLANYSYSFALWIYPFLNNGTILQVSSPSGWCMPMIGFSSNGHLTIQTLSSQGIYTTSLTIGMLLLSSWTHVSMTYSTANGIRLFVNGTLANSNNTFHDYSASDEMNTIIIGTCLQPNTCHANETNIVLSQFRGLIDELRIFSRELSSSEVSQLMASP